ncbi:WXG100-like domain-containing protein [Streptomyces sp. BYX5S]
MSIKASPEVNAMIFILTGEKLIDADEDLAYDSRQPYSGLGRKMDRLSSLIDKSVHDIAEAMPDDLAKSYARAMGTLTDDNGKNYLRQFAEQLDRIAEGRRKTSMDIMESKWQVIAEVIRLLIEIAIYLAMSFFTGGASASQIMMAKLRSRFMILTTLTHLLQRLHLAPALTEAFAEAFTTFAVRLAMMNFAPNNRRPDGFDWNQILKDAAFGAAAGGLTSFFDRFAHNIVKSYDNTFLKNSPDLDFKPGPNLKNDLGPGPGSNTPGPGPKSNDPGPGPTPKPTPEPTPTPVPGGSGITRNPPSLLHNNALSFLNNPNLWRNSTILRDNADNLRGLAGHYGLKGTSDFLAAGAGEALAEIFIKGVFDGDWSTSWSTFVGAGVSSQVESSLTSTALNSGAELRNTIDNLRTPPTVSGGESGSTRSADGDGDGRPHTESGGGDGSATRQPPATGDASGNSSSNASVPTDGPPPYSPMDPPPYTPFAPSTAINESHLWQQALTGPADVRQQALNDLGALRGTPPPGSAEIGLRDGLRGSLSQLSEVRVVSPDGPTAQADVDHVRGVLDGLGAPVTVDTPGGGDTQGLSPGGGGQDVGDTGNVSGGATSGTGPGVSTAPGSGQTSASGGTHGTGDPDGSTVPDSGASGAGDTDESGVPGTGGSNTGGTDSSGVPDAGTSSGSGAHGSGTSNTAAPDTSNVPGTDTSGLPGAGTSSDTNPDTSNATDPDTTGAPGTGTASGTGTDTSAPPRPDTSNASGTDTSASPNSSDTYNAPEADGPPQSGPEVSEQPGARTAPAPGDSSASDINTFRAPGTDASTGPDASADGTTADTASSTTSDSDGSTTPEADTSNAPGNGPAPVAPSSAAPGNGTNTGPAPGANSSTSPRTGTTPTPRSDPGATTPDNNAAPAEAPETVTNPETPTSAPTNSTPDVATSSDPAASPDAAKTPAPTATSNVDEPGVAPPTVVTTGSYTEGDTTVRTESAVEASPEARTAPLTIVVSQTPPPPEGTPEASAVLDGAGTDRAVVFGPGVTPDGTGRPVRSAVELTRVGPGAPVRARPLAGPPPTDTEFPGADVLLPLADALGPPGRPATESSTTSVPRGESRPAAEEATGLHLESGHGIGAQIPGPGGGRGRGTGGTPPPPAKVVVRPDVQNATTPAEPFVTTLDGHTVPVAQLRRWMPQSAAHPRPGQPVRTLTISQSPAEDGTPIGERRAELLGQDSFRGVRTTSGPDNTTRTVFTGPPTALPGADTEEGADYFAGHGTPRTVTLGTDDAAHPSVKVSGVQLGEVLKSWSRDGQQDRPLVLFSCETGRQPAVAGLPVAQHVANRTGRPVYAPTTEVGTARDGDGNVRAVLTEGAEGPGRWRLFTPEPAGATLDQLARDAGLHRGPEPADAFARARTLQQIRTLRDALGPDAEQRPENRELLAGLAYADALRWHSPHSAARYGDGRMTPDLLNRMVTDRLHSNGDTLADPTAGPTAEQYTQFLRAAAELRAGAGPDTTLDALLPPPPAELPPSTLISPDDVRGLDYAPSARVTWSLSTEPLPLSELSLSPEDTAELLRRRPDLAPAPSRRESLADNVALFSKGVSKSGATPDPANAVHVDGRSLVRLRTRADGDCLFRSLLDSARGQDIPPAWAARNVAGLRGLLRDRLVGSELVATAAAMTPDPVLSVVDDLRTTALTGVTDPSEQARITDQWNRIADQVVTDGDPAQWRQILEDSGYPQLAEVAPTPDDARRIGTEGLIAAAAERTGLWSSPFGDLLPHALAHTLDVDLRLVQPDRHGAPGDTYVTRLNPGGTNGTLHLAYNGRDHFDALIPASAPLTTGTTPGTTETAPVTTDTSPVTLDPTATPDPAPDGSDPFGEWLRGMGGVTDVFSTDTTPKDTGETVPLETQLERHRPARLMTGPDAAAPGPAPRTVTFDDGSRLPTVLINPDADPTDKGDAKGTDGTPATRAPGSRTGLFTGLGTLNLRSPELAARQILDGLPPKLRSQFDEAELLRLLTEQPGAFTAPRGARFVGREKSGVGHELTVEAVPYHRWERFNDIGGGTTRLDTMRRGQSGTGGARSVGVGRRIAGALSLGPPLNWLLKIGVSLGWNRRTDFTLGTQGFHQSEYRAFEGSHLHLDDVHYRVRVERVTEAPKTTGPATGDGNRAPNWRRTPVHTAEFAMRDGLSWRLPDDLTVPYTGTRRAPETLTFLDGVEPRMTDTTGLHLTDPPEDLALAISGARPGSSAHRTLVSYVRPGRLLGLFGRLAGPVTSPELTRGSGHHPLGHLIVERSVPHRATLVAESVKAEVRDLTQTTYQNQRAHVRDTRFGAQVTSGPNHSLVGPDVDVRIQGGPQIRSDVSTGRGHYYGVDAARKVTGRVRNHPVALYRVERTLMVRAAGQPASAARPVRVVSLDWMSTQDARRLAGWDSRTPGRTGPNPDAEPPVPWYLTREDPVHLGGQIRAEGFRPDTTATTGPKATLDATPDVTLDPKAATSEPKPTRDPKAAPDPNRPQDPLRVFADTVLDTLHQSYPSLFVPPLMLRHPRLAKLWYGDGRMRTALHNDRQVREALNRPTLAQSLDDLTTTGVPVTLTEDGKVRRGHHTLILKARLTDRRFETTMSERSLRNAVIGTEVSGQGEQASSALSGGVELGISPRDHTPVPGTTSLAQIGNVTLGARYGRTDQTATRSTSAVTHDNLAFQSTADLYSYRVELGATFEGHRRPRGWTRLATAGLLGGGIFVSKVAERPLFDGGSASVGRVELAVPSSHGSERYAPTDSTATPSPAPTPQRLSSVEADQLLDGERPLPHTNSADRDLTRKLLTSPHVVLSTEGGGPRAQLMQDTADRASGTTWHVSAPGAPVRTALRRAMANLSVASQLGQYLGPFGARITGLNGAGPLRTHYVKGAVRGELTNVRVKSDPKPGSLEATLGNERRILGSSGTTARATVGLQGSDIPYQRAPGHQAATGTYQTALQYAWGKGRSISETVTRGRSTTLSYAGRMYLVAADATETVAVRDRWTAAMGTIGTRAGTAIASAAGRVSDRLGRSLAPRKAAAALQRVKDAVMMHLPMQDAIEAGLAPDGLSTDTPRNLGGGYRVPAFLRGRRFPTHPAGQLDAGHAAHQLLPRLAKIGVPSHDREQVLQRLSPDFLRAHLHELTTDGMTLPVRYRSWSSPHHLAVGGSPGQVTFKLTPVTTTVERLRTGYELEDYRNNARDHADARVQDRGGDVTLGVGERMGEGPLIAGPAVQGTATQQQATTHTRTAGSTAMPNIATTQAHAEIVTDYILTVTMTDATGGRLSPRAVAHVGALHETAPVSLLTPDGDGADGALTERDVPEPERAVRMRTPEQARPDGIAEWRTAPAGNTPGASDVLPFDDRIGSGILAVDIRGAANVQDALTLATARADGFGDSDPGKLHTGNTLKERVRMARHTPLTGLGTAAAQAQQEATSQGGLTAGLREALGAHGSELPTQASARLFGQSHTADSRLYAKMHRTGARLLAVENKPRMEAMRRAKTSDANETGITDNVEGALGTGPIFSTSEAGLVIPGATVPFGGSNDTNALRGTSDTTLGTHLKVVTDRSMLFAVPVSWLTVAEADHRLTDSRPMQALGKPVRGPRAAEAETTALVWLREDLARDYGLLDDTSFPDDVAAAWDTMADAAGDLAKAETNYYDARARARETWLALSPDERAALGDGDPDRPTALPRAVSESPAVTAWQAARDEVRLWQQRVDTAAADHHRLHLAASRLTAHHQGSTTVPVPDRPQEYTAPAWRSEAPDPYTVTDAEGTTPRTLTSPDGATVREVHDMPHDGASFFHALLATADAHGRLPHLLGTDLADRFTRAPGDPDVTAEAIGAARDRLATALGDNGNEDLLDALALDAADTFTQAELDAAGVRLTPAQQSEFDAFGRLPQTFWPTPAQRVALAVSALARPFAAEPAPDTSMTRPDGEQTPPTRIAGDHGGADLLPALAARVLGTPLTVVTGEGRDQVFLPHGGDPAAVDPIADPVLFTTDGFFHAALVPGTPAPTATPLPTPATATKTTTSTTTEPPAHRTHATPPWSPPTDLSGPRYRLDRDGVLTAPDGATYTQGRPTGRGNGFFGALATALHHAAAHPGTQRHEASRLRVRAGVPAAQLMRMNGLPGTADERTSLFSPPPLKQAPHAPPPSQAARDGHLRRHLAEAPWNHEADRVVAEWAAAATGTTVTLIEENGTAHTYAGPSSDSTHIRLRRRGGDFVPLLERTPADEAHELDTMSGADTTTEASDAAPDTPPRDIEFTNLDDSDQRHRDKAARIVDLLGRHGTISDYVAGRPVRITLHVRTTETPADVVDRGDEGVQINLASYYFEKYDIGYVMGMLSHEIGLHPLASRNAEVRDEEPLLEGMPFTVPGLEHLNPPRMMSTDTARQADHIMAVFPSSTRHRIYRDIVLGMADVLAADARAGKPGARQQDVTDLIDTYLMDVASIAITSDNRVNAAKEPANTARVYNAYKEMFVQQLADDSPVRALVPADKGWWGVTRDFATLATRVATNNSGSSIRRATPPNTSTESAQPPGEARPRLPQNTVSTEPANETTSRTPLGGPDSRPRFVVRSGFDARRFVFDGEPVTDLTVRVALRGGVDGESQGVFGRLESAVAEFLNGPAYRLPNGDRLHVTVERVAPGESPHLTVDLAGRDRVMDQTVWWADAEPVHLVHELTHQLGLRDEYRDADAPHRPHVPGSLLGAVDESPEDPSMLAAGLRGRHMALLGALIGDLEVHANHREGESSWDAARAEAVPEVRTAVWVDPVALPTVTDGAGAEVSARMPEGVEAEPTFIPFKSGNFEFTNLNHMNERYRDKAVRIIDVLQKHQTIRDYVGGRQVRITLHVRTTETPADVIDRGDAGVDINLASYYFEKYDVGYVMGMLSHEIGLHPLASRNRDIPDEESMFQGIPLPVPGLGHLNPPRTMNTESAGQADHIMAAFPSSTRHRIYRDIVLGMADILAEDARIGEEGAKAKDVTDLIDTYLMDVASIAITSDYRVNAAREPANTAKVYNAYKELFVQQLAADSPVRALVPADKGWFGVARDFTTLAASLGTNNRGDSIQRPLPPQGEARPRLPQAAETVGTEPAQEVTPPVLVGPVDERPRFVVRSGFDARRFVFDGESVTDLTVRVALRGGVDGESQGVFGRLEGGVAEFLNGPAYRLPNGDRLHVTVERVAPGESPHLTVDLAGRDRVMDQTVWWADAEPVHLVHELTHQLGLRDEYRDVDAPHRPHVPGSLLGAVDESPEDASLLAAGLRGRHMALLGALIGDLEVHANRPEGESSWDAARAEAVPEVRTAVWVDPVSLPTVTDGAGAEVPARAPEGVEAEPTFIPFKSGNFEFTNLNHANELYRDKAVRIIDVLRGHDTIRDYVGDRPVRITLHMRTTQTPADVIDRGDAGVDINLASYYFEKYDIGYVMGMLSHEIGLHPLASRNTGIPDEEAGLLEFPLPVPGLSELNPPRAMDAGTAGQADHVMAAFPSTTRHRIYRDIVVRMAENLAADANAGAEGAKRQDVTDLIDTYLMDLASIAVTNDHRANAVFSPGHTARAYQAYKELFVQQLAADSPVHALLPGNKTMWGVAADFKTLATASLGRGNRGDSIQRPLPPAPPAGEARPRLPQQTSTGEPTGGANSVGHRTPAAPRDDRPRFVVRSGFDARRFTFDGEPVTDLTVRVALRGGEDGQPDRVFGQLDAAVGEFLNGPAYRLPNGDRLHVTVEHVSPEEAPHLTVDLIGRDQAMDQTAWWTDAAPVQLAHELAHQIGLRDEYREAGAEHRPDIPGSLLGIPHQEPEDSSLAAAGLRGRHLALIGTLIGDLDLTASEPAPVGTRASGAENAPSWGAARTNATPVPREAVWVDPVSLPLPDATATEVPPRAPTEPNAAPDPAPAYAPFRSGNVEFTNLKHTDRRYRDKAVRIIELLQGHDVVNTYIGSRPCRITLHKRDLLKQEPPADVVDLGDEGVQINLASYYFETYDIGHVMGMLAHEIGLHPLASRDTRIEVEEAMFDGAELPVPGLEGQNPRKFMTTEGAGQKDHIMAAYHLTRRHAIYRDVVLGMAELLRAEGRPKDVKDLFDCFLMDLASIAVTNDHRGDAAKAPGNTAASFNAYNQLLREHLTENDRAALLEFLPSRKTFAGVLNDFRRLGTNATFYNNADSIQPT